MKLVIHVHLLKQGNLKIFNDLVVYEGIQTFTNICEDICIFSEERCTYISAPEVFILLIIKPLGSSFSTYDACLGGCGSFLYSWWNYDSITS